MEWQPIDTVPKDGTRVLLTKGISVVLGHWESNPEYGGDKEEDEIGPGFQIFSCEDSWYSWAIQESYFTHWMPLPEPPTT